ncbi:FMN-binding protein [Aequorivita sp. F47161]|uniref:FMN-binding protein n=1 Tax=Aequorivita vitellina TaxID=2874475 RepID=A0A9X1U0Z5_9FLAO|nr:FMN-binding protein [Aequorivita vitellina]MCG2419419.1 FMN-binding protein [Aequorivita vitellina]
MNTRFFILFITSFVFVAFSVPDNVAKKAHKEMVKFYETENISKEIISVSKDLNAKTVSEFGDENLFKIISNGKFIGYGYIGNAPSKTATFDYLVLFDKDFVVTHNKVLIYREEYGGEISSKRWLKQFLGASPSSEEFLYNRNIIPISGATISVKSLTTEMNSLMKSIAILQKLKAL